MSEEWWLTAAVSDAALVAELLLRFKHPSVNSFTWGARHPRSSVNKKKRRHARRRGSPTTPLSWSDDASDQFGSKISASSTESPSTSTSCKRHPRNKAFAELKDEESSLLKERTQLKKELVGLQSTLDEQRSVNNHLKRRKLDFPMASGTNSEAKFIQLEEATTQNGTSEVTSNVSRQANCEEASQESHSCSSQQKLETLVEPSFVLPDLNMMPDEDC